MTFTPQFRVPGPTPVPARVQRAMMAPMINHRGPEFKELLATLEDGLRWIFQTRNDMLIFPATGTGGLESAVANVLSPGEKVLVVSIGAFGDRFAEAASVFGAEVIRYAVPWGQAADPEDLDETLVHEPDVRTVLITHNETSTGVTNPLQQLAEVVNRHNRLLVVDGVSSVGCIDLPVDAWGADVVITASQKGLMAPPGVTVISVSAAAWERQAAATAPRFYLDWGRERQFQAQGATFTTPAISVLFGLREGLRMMQEEGLTAIFARHLRLAAGFRSAVSALGLQLVADPEAVSPTVTAVHLPESLWGEKSHTLFETWADRYGLVLQGGQGPLSGKIFRLGHMGAVYEEDVLATAAALEAGLRDHGYIPRASAVESAKRALDAFEPSVIR